MPNLTFGSVCSGIEAASVAFAPLGWKAVWLAEVDVPASQVLAYHYGATAPRFPLDPDEPGLSEQDQKARRSAIKAAARLQWGDRIVNWGDMTRIAEMIRSGEAEAPDILCGGTPCFAAGHVVLTAGGYLPIEDVRPGDMVVTHEGRLRPVRRIGSKVAQVGRLDMVGLSEGIVCTADHRFLARHWRNQSTKRLGKYARIETVGEPTWVNASEMPGQQWLSRTTFDIPSNEDWPGGISVPDAMLLAGFYLGDGWTRTWTKGNKKAVMLGLNETKYATFADMLPDVRHCAISERTVVKVQITNTSLAQWLERHFGRLAGGKRMPAWALSHPERARLFEGYLLTDGGDDGRGKWTASSVSKSLAFGIATLAQTLNVTASVSMVRTSDEAVIEGRLVQQQDYWLARGYPSETSRKSRRAGDHLLRTCSKWTPLGEDVVYDIEVAEDHSFILNGAIVHNCQSFSVAGARRGLEDARGNLALSFIQLADAIDERRALEGKEPCIVIFENVPGLLSSKDNAFGCFLGALAGEDDPLIPAGKRWTNAGVVLGPERAVAWRVGDAQYRGLAQRRRRIFLVGSAREGFDPAGILFEFDGVRRDSPPSREAGEGVAATLDARPTGGGFPGSDGACGGHVVPAERPRDDRPVGLIDDEIDLLADLNTHTHTHRPGGTARQ